MILELVWVGLIDFIAFQFVDGQRSLDVLDCLGVVFRLLVIDKQVVRRQVLVQSLLHIFAVFDFIVVHVHLDGYLDELSADFYLSLLHIDHAEVVKHVEDQLKVRQLYWINLESLLGCVGLVQVIVELLEMLVYCF